MVGILLRTIYTCRQDFPDQKVMADAELIESDTSAIIKKVCNDIRKKNESKYIDSGKVTAGMFEKYFIVLEEELREKFIGKDGHDFSLYESLKKLSPNLTKEDYKKNHRNSEKVKGCLNHHSMIPVYTFTQQNWNVISYL